mgnify:CR=1 FL=1
MKRSLLQFLLLVSSLPLSAQLYFPPGSPGDWETIAPEELGWCPNEIDNLYDFLEGNNSKAFIVLKDGKIVLEQYFNGHGAEIPWFWASAGKTLVAFLAGRAQEEGFLNINDPTADYLGQGWTDCPDDEADITIWHQLTMTSGLDDGFADPFCTQPECLQCLAEPGTRWSYHNAPYTLLRDVLESATGQSINMLMQDIKSETGMGGLFIEQGFNNVYFSDARSMARFGLLILAGGQWDGTPLLSDITYFKDMITPSQDINPAYGYLWWLNGQNSYMVPQTQFVFSGGITPNAPADMVSALGANGQIINVVPSQNLVMIRMGQAPGNDLVPYLLNDQIWERFNALACEPVSTAAPPAAAPRFYPNPAGDYLFPESLAHLKHQPYQLLDAYGRAVASGTFTGPISLAGLPAGLYTLAWKGGSHRLLKQ